MKFAKVCEELETGGKVRLVADSLWKCHWGKRGDEGRKEKKKGYVSSNLGLGRGEKERVSTFSGTQSWKDSLELDEMEKSG